MGSEQHASSDATVVHEIFSGLQGEGILVGVRQVFVRFHGCHLRCRYCDTPSSRSSSPATCVVEDSAGTRITSPHANPLTIDDVMTAVRDYYHEVPHHSVSLTGGEPLLQCDFLNRLLPALHMEGYRSYLETNGCLPEALTALAVVPHFIAADVKLPLTACLPPDWERQRAFLQAAISRLRRDSGRASVPERLQIKLVFGEGSEDDLLGALDVIATCCTDVPCILQPVTPRSGGPAAPAPDAVLNAHKLFANRLKSLRVIPQTHVMMGQW